MQANEFIATDSKKDIFGSGIGSQGLGKALQVSIPSGMTERIVDAFEAVDILT